MRTCAQPVTIRAMPENEIPPATPVDIYCMQNCLENKSSIKEPRLFIIIDVAKISIAHHRNVDILFDISRTLCYNLVVGQGN